MVAIAVASLSAAVVTSGIPQLVFVAVVGFAVAACLVIWVAGDVRALRHAWGAVGEEQTAAVLAQLGPEWLSVHDVPRTRGNWDHICVGPGGVFALESKNLSDAATVSGDRLRAGRIPYPGATFRRAAIELKEEIARQGVRPPWVHAVVVNWGRFEEQVHEEERVTYIAGNELLAWLRSRPVELSDARLADIRSAVVAFAEGRRHHTATQRPALEPSA